MATSLRVSKENLERYEVDNKSLYALSFENPVMLVFLRHLGCVFCREALRDVAAQRAKIEETGVMIVLIHMEEVALARAFVEKYGLAGVHHVSDPDRKLYAQFGLAKGTISQLFGLRTLVRGMKQGVSLEQFGGSSFGDAFQMPGVFIIREGEIAAEYVHRTVSDRPDYYDLAAYCTI
ncbi:MAG: AhpC/TSA family protein [Saprospiraceae bacterium]|nr:AhpC/TSA family protein [Saprospiraceae bacterium]